MAAVVNGTKADVLRWNVDAFVSFLNLSIIEEESQFEPPVHIFSDYLEISSLAFIMPIGAIFNLFILSKLFMSYQHRTNILHLVSK